MIVMRREVRGMGMYGQGGFETLKITFTFTYTYLHSWGWSFCLWMFCRPV